MIFKFLKAQNGDCTLINYTDENGIPRNIIIDSGLASTYFDHANNIFGELKTEIDDIKTKGQSIDLIILTHIDNDHICGFLKLFEMDKEIPNEVKKVWFNSGKLIAEKLNEQENKLLSVGLEDPGVVNTGVSEGIDFENFLLRHKFWERELIVGGQEHSIHGAHFQILGPTLKQLKKLLKEYHEKTEDDLYTSGTSNDWATDISTFIQEEDSPGFRFSQDSSVKNGSSISFILTLKDKKFIFLADGHPNPIVKQLNELGYSSQNPLSVEFIKVSHHGSKANNNKKLFSVLKTENYMISTNSEGHGHPHKRTLARIIANNPDAIFHFNYENVWEGVFNDADRAKYPIRAWLTPLIQYFV